MGLDAKDFLDAFQFAVAVVGGSIAIIVVLFGLGVLFFHLISIITGVPMPIN